MREEYIHIYFVYIYALQVHSRTLQVAGAAEFSSVARVGDLVTRVGGAGGGADSGLRVAV